jgi:hypothetical protein
MRCTEGGPQQGRVENYSTEVSTAVTTQIAVWKYFHSTISRQDRKRLNSTAVPAAALGSSIQQQKALIADQGLQTIWYLAQQADTPREKAAILKP